MEILKSKYLDRAKFELRTGLDDYSSQFNLLVIASEVMRLQGDYKRSLDYAYLLTYHHPDHWEGFTIAAQNFIALTNYNEAMQKIQEGLERFPEQPHLLEAAVHVSRAYGDHEKSLNYARLLVKFYPEKWHGYLLIAQDFAALKKLIQHCSNIKQGLQNFQYNLNSL